METLTLFLENRAAEMVFGAVVLLACSAYLGIRVVPRHFNEAQIKKIIYAAAFTSGIIGAFPIGLGIYFFLEGWMPTWQEFQDQKWLQIMAAISGSAYLSTAFFFGIEKELKKKLRYQEMGLIYQILSGLALFVGVVGLFGIKALKESPDLFDFYAEADQGEGEAELG